MRPVFDLLLLVKPFSFTVKMPTQACLERLRGLEQPKTGIFFIQQVEPSGLSKRSIITALKFWLAFTTTVTVPSLSVTIDLIAGGTYYWRVRAKNINGVWGSWSYAESFTVNTAE